MTIKSDFAIVDIKTGRNQLKRTLEGGATVPVIIEGVIDTIHSNDDGISREFSLRVTKLTTQAPVRPFITVRAATTGTEVLTDGGFTCMPANATKMIYKDDHGKYVQCKDGRHYLDGQLDDKGHHYVGLYRKVRKLK